MEDKKALSIQIFSPNYKNNISYTSSNYVDYTCVLLTVNTMFVLQLSLFAHTRYSHVNYTWGNRVTFSHLFIKGWDSAREIVSYPPAMGPLAIYNIESFYSTIDYAVAGVSTENNIYKYCHALNDKLPHLNAF